MPLSEQALSALIELDNGAKFNAIHTTSRELIAAGYAFDGWGYLEITERGRRKARERNYRNFAIDDEQIHNMATQIIADVDRARAAAPDLPEDPIKHLDADDLVELARAAPKIEHVGRLWSRDRAIKAAGVANGKTGTWVDASWVKAFMDEYERADDAAG